VYSKTATSIDDKLKSVWFPGAQGSGSYGNRVIA